MTQTKSINAAANSEFMTQSIQEGLTSAMQIPKALFEINLDTGAELMTFVSRRLKAQASLLNGVGHCKDATQAMEMQRAFWGQVTKDYSEEMNRLSDVGRKNLEVMSELMAHDTKAQRTDAR